VSQSDTNTVSIHVTLRQLSFSQINNININVSVSVSC